MRTSVPTIAQLPKQTSFGGFEFTNVFAFVALMWRVARERNQLKDLDPRMLADIGLSQKVADREADRAFFDVPGHRKDKHWH